MVGEVPRYCLGVSSPHSPKIPITPATAPARSSFLDHGNNNEGASGIKNMEHLETQVSDLRSFLPGALPSAASTPTSNAAHMAGVGVVAGVGPGAATAATAPRHPSQSAGSSVSAVGSNSAHPSPLAFGPNHNAQPARNHGSAVSTPGPVSAHRAATNGGGGAAAGGAAAAAGAKRKLNDTASGDDSSQRQQRSKRNRVSTSQVLEGASGLLTVASVAVYSTSPLLGMS